MFLSCPKCKLPMKAIEYEGIRLESCDTCGGEWLDPDELKKVTDLREEQFDPEIRRAVAEAASVRGLPLEDQLREFSCPKCDGALEPFNYGGGSGLILDKCDGCGGFWLDDTELEKVQMLVEGWDDALSDDLARYSGTLHDVETGTEALDSTGEIRHSRLPLVGRFINACVNGVIDLGF